jgi:hypothetical protein
MIFIINDFISLFICTFICGTGIDSKKTAMNSWCGGELRIQCRIFYNVSNGEVSIENLSPHQRYVKRVQNQVHATDLGC